MIKEAVYHQMDSTYAYPVDMETMIIRLRVKKNDVKRCMLFYGDRCYEANPVKMEQIEMKISESDKYFDYFEAEFKTPWKRICYYFSLDDGTKRIYYYNGDFFDYIDENRTKYYQYAYIRSEDLPSVPAWTEDAIIYQIFPDSFASDEKMIDNRSKEVKLKDGFVSRALRGGTLKGIVENINYLNELGINCLYLNPIFRADSYHKYDIIDYYEIDPCLGDKEDFKRLVDICHDNGIKVILDGVFNHTSTHFFAFDDIIKNGEISKYKDWYMVHSYPVQTNNRPNYEAFAYVASMPRTNTSNPEVVKYFTEVGKYWIEQFNIDGWRLDVANEIDHNFWREFRREIKSVNKDIFIIAEIWEDCHSFLNGDQFDSAMNYNFTYACEDFFAQSKMKPSVFDEKLGALRSRYKRSMQMAMMNLLDSHDVKRFLYTCEEDVQKLKLASTFQFTYEGIPSIYYGDEVGISGFTDDEIRSGMRWKSEERNLELLEHFKKLIKLRKENRALRIGTTETVIADDSKGIYGYKRRYNMDIIIVLFNVSNSDNKIVLNETDGGAFMDLYSGEIVKSINDKQGIHMKPYQGRILTLIN